MNCNKTILCGFITLLLLLPNVSAENVGGEDIDPEDGETIFESIDHTQRTPDLEKWEISLKLTDDAANNGTTFTLTTQICNNEGTCFPPEERPLTSDDNVTFTSFVTTIDDHSYVNWRIIATYENDDSERFPSSGFYKTWSNCWYYEGSWGGEGCDSSNGGSEKLPAITAIATMGAILIAAFINRD